MYLKMAWRNIWRNKKRSIITIASVLFAFFFAVAMRTMQFGTYESMINNVVGLHGGYLQIHKKGYWDDQTIDNTFALDSALLQKIRSLPDIKAVAPRLEGFALAAGHQATRGVIIMGMDPSLDFSDLVNPEKIVSGRLVETEDQGFLVAKGLSELLQVTTGDTLVLLGQGYHGMSAACKYPVLGVVKMNNPQLNDAFLMLPLGVAQEFYSTENQLTALAMMTEDDVDIDEVQNSLQHLLAPDKFEVMNWREMMPELVQGIQVDSAGGLIMLYILYLVISFGIFGTLLMLTHERRYEFGIMLSVGMKRIRLMGVLLLEITMMSFIGVITGVVFTWPVVFYFNRNPIKLTGQAAEAMKDYGIEPLIPTALDMSVFLMHGGVVLLISILLSIYPLSYVYRLKPIDALKDP